MTFNTSRLIGKLSGGNRGIAQTSLLYKAWARRALRSLEDRLDASDQWDFARAGRSAWASAMFRAAMCEVAALLGWCVVGLLWDLSAFFDQVEPGFLCRELLALGCPTWILPIAFAVHLGPRAVRTPYGCVPFASPVRSVLQGCSLAGHFAKALYRR